MAGRTVDALVIGAERRPIGPRVVDVVLDVLPRELVGTDVARRVVRRVHALTTASVADDGVVQPLRQLELAVVPVTGLLQRDEPMRVGLRTALDLLAVRLDPVALQARSQFLDGRLHRLNLVVDGQHVLRHDESALGEALFAKALDVLDRLGGVHQELGSHVCCNHFVLHST
jgi:hypothetical protein